MTAIVRCFIGGDGEHWDSFSDDARHRYELGAEWDPRKPRAVWLLCNPSKARAGQHDPSSRKVEGFSKRWGCGSWVIVNPCSKIATDPKELRGESGDFTRPGNLARIRAVLETAKAHPAGYLLLYGWGNALPRARVKELFAATNLAQMTLGLVPRCLGYTVTGDPRHPLMLGYRTPLEPFVWGQG